ncbi:hypothetical protein PR202_gb20506 [Eleusine coracana subsp. coracana]|uniref:Disease resistance R13L4/SHOC-2-like LRR domain-containing protein n=1 Tax=Eleusine coracana subsp. coracana TaxID=191504 RepID=A0AAV5FCF0_ELECO|nr:hypothetical protein QOZ80_1BG0063390 [Eleusine coracana subsp. coracana]GJN32035.1 hypothetical protein PR202_gb20506 [Eleusine coracana subsp. coracana]
MIPKWISLLDKLSSLKIQVVALPGDGVEALAKLPSLLHLTLSVQDHVPEEGVIIYSKAFQNLKEFWFKYEAPCLTFEAGAMPRLLSLSIDCYAQRAQQDNGILAGIEHLVNLKSFKVRIYNRSCVSASYAYCSKSQETLVEEDRQHKLEMCDIHNLQAALKKAINKHPRKSDISIVFW